MPEIAWSFWFLLSGGIAFVLGVLEVVQNNIDRAPVELFRSAPLYLLGALNFLLAVAFYFLLPTVAQSLFAEGMRSYLIEPWSRALVAGFGIGVLARLSLFDVKVGEKTIGVGFDTFYTILSTYLTGRLSKGIQRQLRLDFQGEYKKDGNNEDSVFSEAVQQCVVDADIADREKIKTRCREAKEITKDGINLCFSYYLIIRDNTSGREEATRIIVQHRSKIAPPQAS